MELKLQIIRLPIIGFKKHHKVVVRLNIFLNKSFAKNPVSDETNLLFYPTYSDHMKHIREVKIDVYGRPVTANAKIQVGFSGEVLAVRN